MKYIIKRSISTPDISNSNLYETNKAECKQNGACLVNKRTLSRKGQNSQNGFVVFFVAVTCTSNSPTCNVAPFHKKSSQLQRSVGFIYKTHDSYIVFIPSRSICNAVLKSPILGGCMRKRMQKS